MDQTFNPETLELLKKQGLQVFYIRRPMVLRFPKRELFRILGGEAFPI